MTNLRKNYTQFFTAIELGDVEEIKYHIKNGLDPMQKYNMDGKSTNPIKSSLKKGDVNTCEALLDSKKVKVGIQDLLTASPKIEIDERFISKLAICVDQSEINEIIKNVEQSGSLDSSIKSYVKSKKQSGTNFEIVSHVINHLSSGVEDIESEVESTESESEKSSSGDESSSVSDT